MHSLPLLSFSESRALVSRCRCPDARAFNVRMVKAFGACSSLMMVMMVLVQSKLSCMMPEKESGGNIACKMTKKYTSD